MAIKHICDGCGAEIDESHGLWEVSIYRMRKARFIDNRYYERFELCDKCKQRVRAELIGGR